MLGTTMASSNSMQNVVQQWRDDVQDTGILGTMHVHLNLKCRYHLGWSSIKRHAQERRAVFKAPSSLHTSHMPSER
jgi:hypothetical protein